MAEALDHEWLAGPSSQPQDFLQDGGPIFPIVDFDERDNAVNSNMNRSWSRPMTESGTNLESGLNGSNASFSQPMGNLNLGTPAPSRRGASADMEVPLLSDREDGMALDSPSRPPTAPFLTPPPDNNHTLKRKQHDPRIGLDPFSSGSLSPPPPEGPEKTPTACSKPEASASPRRSTRPRKSLRLL